MEDNSGMAKDQITKASHAERIQMLMQERDSPKGIDMGRRALEHVRIEYLEILDILGMAARRLGVELGPLPALPAGEATDKTEESMRLGELVNLYRTHKDLPCLKL